ncbi:COG5001 Predicted signal transduction protein containing a membrane domain, an EAL and a GGDEF domain [Comamonadaceae bacterium]
MPDKNLRSLGTQELIQLLEMAPVPLFVKDTQGHVIYVNQSWRQSMAPALGGTSTAGASDVLSKQQLDYFHKRDIEAFSSGNALTLEDVVRGNGQENARHTLTTLVPLFDAVGQPAFIVGSTVDITEQHQLQQQNAAERSLLEMLASDVPLQSIMSEFILRYETIFPGILGSVLLMDEEGQHLMQGASPSLPTAYSEAIHGMPIGPEVGSCGTAAYTAREVLVSDIANDPRWADYKTLALSHGLRACWSVPIRSTKGKVIGTFANYYRVARMPSDSELQAARRSAYLLSLAIENDLNDRQIQQDRQAIEEAGRYRQAILDSMVDGLVTLDLNGRIHTYNNAACRMMGRDPNAMRPQTLNELLGTQMPVNAAGHLTLLGTVDSIEGSTVEVNGRHANGALRPISVSASRIPHTEQDTFVVTLRDITQQRQDEEEIRRLAFYDPLTGLPNRRLLMDRVRQAMVNSARLSQHGALMFLDLDHFKLLNDTLGHDVGDELLQQVAYRLRSCVREGDSVARLGGDEFVVLLEGLSESPKEAANQAEVVAHKILDALALPYSLRGHGYNSTPSIGIVVFMEDQETMDDLLKKADVAMYQAKAAGRNTARFFDPVMQAAVTTHAELAKEIRLGLQRHEFVLHYQVQIDSQGRCTGAEALVRWNHRVRGLVSPAHFIPLAEETGMILPLGEWVLESACQQLVEWSRNPMTAHWTLAVNVSASQLAQPEFVSSVSKVLQRSGAPAAQLKLELTESMLVNDVEDIIVKMMAIKELGVSFSLDDFGTGYSSLSYLKRLPLSQLKIDQSFVRDVLTDPSDAVIARTVVALGHSLGLTVIAEGVETVEQRNALAAMQCDAFQGYFFGRPAPADALILSAGTQNLNL